MKKKFTYDQLMQWDKNDLVEELLDAQSDIEHLRAIINSYLLKNK
jgi:hypothetical protein